MIFTYTFFKLFVLVLSALVLSNHDMQNNLVLPQGYKTFSSSAQLSMKFQLLINVEIVKISGKFRFKTQKISNLSCSTIVGILTFTSRINFSLS